MGDFTAEAPVFNDKMGETASRKADLEVSVSFGRFENDSLSWEKWSTFSPNRYLDEVEKCATPGSVAQKRAYFEAHYKKIAARRAELLAQQETMDKDPLRLDDQNVDDLNKTHGGVDSELDVFKSQSSSSEETKKETDFTGDLNSTTEVDNPVEDFAVTAEGQSTTVDKGEDEGEKKDVQSGSDGLKISNHEEDDELKELTQNMRNDMPTKVSEAKAKIVKSHHPKEYKKVRPTTKESNASKSSKKPVSSMHKASPISTQREPKTTQTPSKVLKPGSSTKQRTSPSPSVLKSKQTSTAARQGVGNQSLHMSISLRASNADSASPTTMRKSVILEKMGDRDIVRRAFKTFQNNSNQSRVSGEDGSSIKKQASSRGTETGISTSMNTCKENGRPTKVKDIDKKGAGSVVTNFGLKSDIRAEKRKEFLKNLEEKSNAKKEERTRLQSKSQEEKEAEIKNLRKNLNFKATPMPGFYQKQKTPKSTSVKGKLESGTQINPQAEEL